MARAERRTHHEVALPGLDAYPGAVVRVGFDGEVRDVWTGVDAPLSLAGALGRPLHELLGFSDDGAEAGALQLWLACAQGTSEALWRAARHDPPAFAPACDLHGGIALEYGPILVDGRVEGVLAFLRAAAAPPVAAAAPRRTAARPAAAPAFSPALAQALVDLVQQCDAAALRIATDREARSAVRRLFRAVHTLKGDADAAGLATLRDAAHATEDVLAGLRELDRPIDRAELDRITAGLARIRAEVTAVTRDHAARDAMTAFHERARPLIGRMQRALEQWVVRLRVRRYPAAIAGAARALAELAERAALATFARRAASLGQLVDDLFTAARIPRSAQALVEQRIDELDVLLAVAQTVHLDVLACAAPDAALARLEVAAEAPARLPAVAAELLELGVVSVDRILRDGGVRAAALADAVADAAAMFAPAPVDADAPLLGAPLARLRAALGDEPVARDAIAGFERALTEVALDDLEGHIRRVVDAVGDTVGKRVEVEVTTAPLGIDRRAFRALCAMLGHAVRNAIDHGIEAPAERVAADKPAVGRLTVRIDADDDGLFVEVSDDGRGIDPEVIRATAVERGLLSAEAAAAATGEQLVDLVFLPGFSTAARTTSVSGRGVGMDAIRDVARELGGRVRLSSKPGLGAHLAIWLPRY